VVAAVAAAAEAAAVADAAGEAALAAAAAASRGAIPAAVATPAERKRFAITPIDPSAGGWAFVGPVTSIISGMQIISDMQW
jgi:hypothetical protein